MLMAFLMIKVIVVKLMMKLMMDLKKTEGVSDHLRDLLCLWPLP